MLFLEDSKEFNCVYKEERIDEKALNDSKNVFQV